ncbi:MAG: hypothetical protein EBV77_12105, partial [Gemmatimonadaceae bacterium]|nr:hypothetical protein [Gemmatimonadaceae bacterium]
MSRRLLRLLVSLAAMVPIAAAGAQVKPDSTKRTDSVTVAAPGTPTATPPAANAADDSVAQEARMRARI